ncbi:low specificity L-threonine aldolase [Pelagibius litoralis]|uniref:L-threonine aldolase n=1 Tax=Pelagibius litoralis TaxID=374515 RepID=A0A967EZW3_9PROT|nr:low specificity L-threonine aldolase [Pelagibius litoralis]NIA70464.1 low specificity L-threonine aldolase [Pelagibius litoralis]
MSNFASDNVTGISPAIMAALEQANSGSEMPYGEDTVTRRLTAQVSELFERDCAVFPVATGSAANSLALASLVPRYGAVYCHREAHINVDECGGPEFFTGGAKLVVLDGPAAKIDAAAVEAAIDGAGDVHRVQPAAISITQASELGAVYRPDEVAALAAVAQRHGLAFHMDGARFANALASLGCRPAEITWRAGIDVLTLGATKNGAMAAEAVIFFSPDKAGDFEYLRKRGGHLFSKMRFVSAQLEAYLTEDHWLDNARHANAQAARLAEGLGALPGIRLQAPVQANELFLALPDPVIKGLEARGFEFYSWGASGAQQIRLVAAFNTRPEDVEAFIAAAAELTGATAARESA